MKKKPTISVSGPNRSAATRKLAPLIEQVRTLVQSARRAAAASVNYLQVMTNFEIGRLIVEHEQQGQHRAGYGKEMLKQLSAKLTAEFGRGFSATNLEYMRKFFRQWRDRVAEVGLMASDASGQIPQTLSEELLAGHESRRISQTQSAKSSTDLKRQTASDQLIPIPQTPSGKSSGVPTPLVLSWSHYVFLLGIHNADERSFYEIEAAQSGWSLSELKRQFDSSLYERLALSRDKKRVRKLAREGHTITEPADLLKEPFVLEFLGLDAQPAYSESDLESAIIDKLQKFLLELGKGFLFEARQKRFTFGEDHFFVDLVFYNRLLRCYVLIDLKIGKLTHQDLGQMQMYVNHYDREVKLDDEHPTVGIILCKKKHDALVKITLPREANIFASEYKLYLPSKEDLRQRLMEWTRDLPALETNWPARASVGGLGGSDRASNSALRRRLEGQSVVR